MAGNEKGSPTASEPEVDSAAANTHLAKRVTTKDELHEYRENDGYIIDAENSDGSPSDAGVKLAADGHTRLIPQPSDDPKDPLNWSWRKKHTILFIIAAAAFLPDYGSATGAVTLIPQAAEWNMTPDEVNHSQSGNVFMLGAGGIFAVMLSAYFGRLPVAFYFLVVAFATAAWCAGADTFESFMGARILNGFFSTVTQGGGMMFIQDMFFFHERPRKINIWASFFVMSPYMGPLFAAFMTAFKPWPTPFWVYTAETGVVLLLTMFFVDETYYDRRIPAAEQPDLGSQLSRLLGISQFRSRRVRNTFPQACMRVVKVILKPTVLLTSAYYMLTFAWVVGINTTLSIFLTPLYNFGPLQIGYFYFTPVVAVLLGEMTGHFLHDVLAKRYIQTHKGHFEPEVRLRAVFFSLPFMIVGLVLVGQALENAWHFMALSVSWGLYVYGIMITTVAVSSYCLDSYPEASGEVSAHLNNARTIGGFVISYFQVQWAEKQGTKVSFGVQAAIVAAAFGIIIVLMVFGQSAGRAGLGAAWRSCRCRDKARIYGHIYEKTIEAVLAERKRKRDLGYTAIGHINPFLDEGHYQVCFKSHIEKMEDAADDVRRMREVFRDKVDLLIELHRRLTPAEAITLAEMIKEHKPIMMFVEDPTRPESADAMARVADRIAVPIATGERFSTIYEFQAHLSRNALEFICVDVALCGGITGAKKVAAMAEAHNVQVVPHNPLSPIGLAACLQIAACIPNFAIQ